MNLDSQLYEKMNPGIFNGKSYFGYSPTVLKSGVCKYYRREIFDKFEWCVIEMGILGLKSPPVFTNIVNRLKILLMEEILCLEVPNILEAIKILENIGDSTPEEKICKLLDYCQVVCGLRKSRVTSYLNNWWRYKKKNLNLESLELDKILKYQKPGDSPELLKLGECFIKLVEERKEKMIQIFIELMERGKKGGTRYRRKDEAYLLFEILEDMFSDNQNFLKILNFSKEMFFRKTMKERPYFVVWLLSIVWKYEEIDWEDNISYHPYTNKKLRKYIGMRKRIEIDEDFVIKDYHVNKQYSLAKFGTTGSMVVNEEISILGVRAHKYRKFYQDIKSGKKKASKTTKKRKIIKKTAEKTPPKTLEKTAEKTLDNDTYKSQLPIIPFSEFENVEVLEEGVCGLKVCCLRVLYQGETRILKEMRKSFNYGRDYFLVDSLKTEFGLTPLQIQNIVSTQRLERISKDKKTLKGNWKWVPDNTVYAMMHNFENIGDIGKHKELLSNPKVLKECARILLYDGIFRSSDNILRNILVNVSGELCSIDEGDIFGKRKNIFNTRDWFKNWFSQNSEEGKNLVQGLIAEFNLPEKTAIIQDKMLALGFGIHIPELKKRLLSYESIVFGELAVNI